MIGATQASPIVLAPPTISSASWTTEGIEDALSAYHATGLAPRPVAGRMPNSRQPFRPGSQVVTIAAHEDEAGRRGARALAERLSARGIEVRVHRSQPLKRDANDILRERG